MIPTSKLTAALSADDVVALADDNGDLAADAGVLEAALQAAENEVRHHLHRGGFAADAPLTPLLEDFVVTIAVARLFERRREVLADSWKERLRDTRGMLRAIGAGEPIADVPRVGERIIAAPDDQPPCHRSDTLRSL
jgi:phage gp36-like protein